MEYNSFSRPQFVFKKRSVTWETWAFRQRHLRAAQVPDNDIALQKPVCWVGSIRCLCLLTCFKAFLCCEPFFLLSLFSLFYFSILLFLLVLSDCCAIQCARTKPSGLVPNPIVYTFSFCWQCWFWEATSQ